MDHMASLANHMALAGCSPGKTEEFVKAMGKEHRTGQQGFTRLCVAWLEHLASVEHFDDRNKASVELAKAFRVAITARAKALPMI
jgi:hypothetical protein